MKCKLFIVFISIFLFCSYMIPLGIYLLPSNPATRETEYKIKYLMNELFYQDWHLFAPNPSQRIIKMYIRCSTNKNNWTSWFNPIEKLQKAHENNRFSLKGLYYRQYNYIVTNLRASYHFTDERAVKKAKHFYKLKTLAEKFSGDICLYKMKTTSTTVEFRILDFYPRQYSDRDAKKNRQVYTSQTFGPHLYPKNIIKKNTKNK